MPTVGTQFVLYVPRCGENVEYVTSAAQVAPLPTGSETILVVEDEPEILQPTQPTQPIDLLLTDVMMSATSGPDLARAITTLRPETRLLYMSGCSADLIARDGKLDPDTNFLGKPFTLVDLALRVPQVLDAGTVAA